MADRIVSTPGTCGGRPRIMGTRITVAKVVDCFLCGMSIEDIARSFSLWESDVDTALRFHMRKRRKP